MQTQVFIKDELTGEYYAVACEENEKGYKSKANDFGSPGPNDFPYWTENFEEAYNFETKKQASFEMEDLYDLIDSGLRKPIIIEIEIKKEFLLTIGSQKIVGMRTLEDIKWILRRDAKPYQQIVEIYEYVATRPIGGGPADWDYEMGELLHTFQYSQDDYFEQIDFILK